MSNTPSYQSIIAADIGYLEDVLLALPTISLD